MASKPNDCPAISSLTKLPFFLKCLGNTSKLASPLPCSSRPSFSWNAVLFALSFVICCSVINNAKLYWISWVQGDAATLITAVYRLYNIFSSLLTLVGGLACMPVGSAGDLNNLVKYLAYEKHGRQTEGDKREIYLFLPWAAFTAAM